KKLATVEFSNLDNLQKDIQAARNKVKIDLNKSGHKPKAWWNEELNKLYRLQLAKRKKANTTNAVVDFEIALRAKEEWKQAVKEAKNKNYKERVEELNNCPNTKDAWRFISNVKGNKHKNGDWATEDNLEYLEMLKSQVRAATTIQATQPEKLNSKKSTAGGVDKITFSTLRHLPRESKEKLLKALESSYHNNEVIESWRRIRIVPIPKANKELDDLKKL
ncbi:uncharacterized protein LOC118756569, partial [Rhagoletis pomonella]|uniref:uncharacterized protein LOC118756569 n=1 Tax=Rhagoletis pomonella TaxID=28610 RepID=UPI001780660D